MKIVNTVSAVALAVLMTAVLTLFAVMVSYPSAASVSLPSTERVPTNATPSNERNAQPFDFNNPTTLAWSLELGGTTTAALHDATCTHTTGRVYECHGRTPDNTPETEELTVSINGGSWESN